jgi:signal transduction histidine kinase
LVPALEWQARETSRRTGLVVNVQADNVPDELPEEHKTCIYRIVQEALHNISRHAEARSVNIQVEQTGERLNLSVEDDGRGFDPARSRGLGLIGMEERVANLGGSLSVQAAPGHGTRLAVMLPVGP